MVVVGVDFGDPGSSCFPQFCFLSPTGDPLEGRMRWDVCFSSRKTLSVPLCQTQQPTAARLSVHSAHIY